MLHECVKCGFSSANHSIIVEGGIGYLFCKACANVLESLPTGTIENFVGPKKESWVAKNMREARERRANGESLWVKV